MINRKFNDSLKPAAMLCAAAALAVIIAGGMGVASGDDDSSSDDDDPRLLDLSGLGPSPGTPTLSENELSALVEARDKARDAMDDAMRRIRSGENVFRGALRRLRSQRDETEAALLAYSNRGEPRVFAMGTQDRDFPLKTRLLVLRESRSFQM